jgi:hypothetical protein
MRVKTMISAVALAASLHAPAARAHAGLSEASALSMLPVAVSVAAPVMILSAGAMLTVVAVEVSAEGTVWVLERASDGARASVRLAGNVALASGAAVTVVAIGNGHVLSAAGRALCFIPNELGAALLYHERVTR